MRNDVAETRVASIKLFWCSVRVQRKCSRKWHRFIPCYARLFIQRRLCEIRDERTVTKSASGDGGLLGCEEFVNALFCDVEHLREFGAGVGVLFGGGLGLD